MHRCPTATGEQPAASPLGPPPRHHSKADTPHSPRPRPCRTTERERIYRPCPCRRKRRDEAQCARGGKARGPAPLVPIQAQREERGGKCAPAKTMYRSRNTARLCTALCSVVHQVDLISGAAVTRLHTRGERPWGALNCRGACPRRAPKAQCRGVAPVVSMCIPTNESASRFRSVFPCSLVARVGGAGRAAEAPRRRVLEGDPLKHSRALSGGRSGTKGREGVRETHKKKKRAQQARREDGN